MYHKVGPLVFVVPEDSGYLTLHEGHIGQFSGHFSAQCCKKKTVETSDLAEYVTGCSQVVKACQKFFIHNPEQTIVMLL